MDEVKKEDVERIERLLMAVLWECEKQLTPSLHRQVVNELQWLNFKKESKKQTEVNNVK